VQSRRAFTLIELLIVVAIIGILAAIAIPNFLQAQVRAKVARVQADMRNLAPSMESYYVDYNGYPLDAQYWTVRPEFASFLPRLALLTSPIDYASSVPEDVFAEGAIAGAGIFDSAYRIPYGTGPLVRPYTFDYANRITPTGEKESRAVWARISSRPDSVLWALRSIGPDHEATYLGYSVEVYDPTNGTISDGDIFYTGPGIGIDKPED